MSIELAIAFAVGAAVILALPGPGNLLMLSSAKAGSRRRMLATVVGAVLATSTAMAAALLLVALLQSLSALLATLAGAAGLAALLWFAVTLLKPRAAAALVADNDNFTAAGSLPILRHSYVATLFDRRNFICFAALAAQTMSPAASIIPQVLVFEAIFFVATILAAIAHTYFSRRVQSLLRRLEARKIRARGRGKLHVNAGIVTVGYRRMAA